MKKLKKVSENILRSFKGENEKQKFEEANHFMGNWVSESNLLRIATDEVSFKSSKSKGGKVQRVLSSLTHIVNHVQNRRKGE